MSTITPLAIADKADTVEIWIESFYDYPAMRQCFIGHARNKQEYDDWLRIFLDLLFDVSFYLGGPLLGARGDNGSLLGALAGYNTDWEKMARCFAEYLCRFFRIDRRRRRSSAGTV